ncbi:MAG: PhoU domain-containing protein [Acidimicrobiales bacterium]
MSTDTGQPSIEDRRERAKAQHHLLLRGISNRLDGEFGEYLTRDTIQHAVEDTYADLTSRAKVLTHVPAFVERFTRQRLKALTKNQGQVTDHPPDVLFYCHRNDAVSQMAAALFAATADGRATTHSAGATPSDELLDDAVHALHEVGIELLAEFPKPLTEEIEQAADVIVTLDRHDDIPVVVTKRHVAWRLPDPRPQGLDGYRALRDELTARVEELAAEILTPHPPPTHRAFDADLAELEAAVAAMGEAVVARCRRIGPAIAAAGSAELGRLVDDDDAIDEQETTVAALALELIARRQPVAIDLRTILAMRMVALHLERIADGIVDIARFALAAPPVIDGRLPSQLDAMTSTVADMAEMALAGLEGRDTGSAARLEDLDESMEALHRSLFVDLATAQASGADQTTVLVVDRISRALKRAGEHALDIAEESVFLITGDLVELGRP